MLYRNRELHTLFHTLWSKAVGTPNYDKSEWKSLQEMVFNLMVQAEEAKKPQVKES